MKKLTFLVVIAMALIVFNGCQKDELIRQEADGEVQLQAGAKNPMFEGLDSILFSVENNRLAFESEEEFQKCIDFLATLGDGNFPAFEKEIGFDSYRKKYENSGEWAENLEDDLFATLLNPQGIVQVGQYIFQIDFENEKVIATEDNGASLKSTSTPLEFNLEDDVFALLNGEPQLKRSGCSRCKRGYYSFQTSDGTAKYKVVYQKAGIYFSLQAKIKQNGRANLSLSTDETTCWWKSKKRKGRWDGKASYKTGGYGGTYSYRPYAKRRGLKRYHFNVDFYISDSNGNTRSVTVGCKCS